MFRLREFLSLLSKRIVQVRRHAVCWQNINAISNSLVVNPFSLSPSSIKRSASPEKSTTWILQKLNSILLYYGNSFFHTQKIATTLARLTGVINIDLKIKVMFEPRSNIINEFEYQPLFPNMNSITLPTIATTNCVNMLWLNSKFCQVASSINAHSFPLLCHPRKSCDILVI